MTDEVFNLKLCRYCKYNYGFSLEETINYIADAVGHLAKLSCKYYPHDIDDLCTTMIKEIARVLNSEDGYSAEFINLMDALGYIPEMDIDQIRLVDAVFKFQDIGTAVLTVYQGEPDIRYLGETPKEICEEKFEYSLDADTLDTLDGYINWEEFMKDQLSGHIFFVEGMGWYQLID